MDPNEKDSISRRKRIWNETIPRKPLQSESETGKSYEVAGRKIRNIPIGVTERILNRLGKKGYPIRPLTSSDVILMRELLMSPKTRGASLYLAPYHYGFGLGYIRQASRNTRIPYIFAINHDLKQGFFVVTRRSQNSGGFVILTPVGKAKEIAPVVTKFAKELANETRQHVVIKKADPLLEAELEKRVFPMGGGRRDFTKGFVPPWQDFIFGKNEEPNKISFWGEKKYPWGDYADKDWAGSRPRDDDTYKSPIIFMNKITKPSGKVGKEIQRREREFNNSLHRVYGEDANLEIERYDPKEHLPDAMKILRQWARDFAKRKGEDKQSAIDANKVFLQVKPDFLNMATYIIYIRKNGKSGEVERIPMGFSTFERTGFVTKGSVKKMFDHISPEAILHRNSQSSLLRQLRVNSRKYVPRSDRLGKKSGWYSPNEVPHSAMALTANIAVTSKVRHMGFMQLHLSLGQLAVSSQRNSPVAMVNLGGSEELSLLNSKMVFDPDLLIQNWHQVIYPDEKRKRTA